MCTVLISTRLDECKDRKYMREEKRPENSISEEKSRGHPWIKQMENVAGEKNLIMQSKK